MTYHYIKGHSIYFSYQKSIFSLFHTGVKVYEATDPAISHIVLKEESIDRGPAPAIPSRSKPSSNATTVTSKSKPPSATSSHRPPLPDRQSAPKQKDTVTGREKVGKSPLKPTPTPVPEKPQEDDDDIYYGDYEEITEEKVMSPCKKGSGYVNDILCQVKPFSGQKPPDDEDESDEYEAIEEKLMVNGKDLIKKGGKGVVEPQDSDIYSVPMESQEITQTNQDEVSEDDEYAVPDDACELKTTRNLDVKEEIVSQTDNVSRENFVSGKSIQELGEILVTLRLEKYVDSFAKDLIDGEIVVDLTVEDLKDDYQFTKTEAIRLKKYIEQGHIPT